MSHLRDTSVDAILQSHALAVMTLANSLSLSCAPSTVQTVLAWMWAGETLAAFGTAWHGHAFAVFLRDAPSSARNIITVASEWLERQRAGGLEATAATQPALYDRARAAFCKAAMGAAREQYEVFCGWMHGEGSTTGRIRSVSQLEDLFMLDMPRRALKQLSDALESNRQSMSPPDLAFACEIVEVAGLYSDVYNRPEFLAHPRIQMQDFVSVVGLAAVASGRDAADIRSILVSYTRGQIDLGAIASSAIEQPSQSVPATLTADNGDAADGHVARTTTSLTGHKRKRDQNDGGESAAATPGDEIDDAIPQRM